MVRGSNAQSLALRLSRADEQRQGTCRGEDATGMMISLMRYSLYGQRIFTNFIS
jgi:hypothetical protein